MPSPRNGEPRPGPASRDSDPAPAFRRPDSPYEYRDRSDEPYYSGGARGVGRREWEPALPGESRADRAEEHVYHAGWNYAREGGGSTALDRFHAQELARQRRYNDYRGGGHRGLGPKDYRRSDERIREDVCDHLAHHDELDASEIEVRVADSEVTLSGFVQSRYERRLAEDLCELVGGVGHVQNNLRVQSSSPAGSPPASVRRSPRG